MPPPNPAPEEVASPPGLFAPENSRLSRLQRTRGRAASPAAECDGEAALLDRSGWASQSQFCWQNLTTGLVFRMLQGH